jgi:hypothetical protein
MKHFWTPEQLQIVKKIRKRYRSRGGQIQWRKALVEHPEWRDALPKHLTPARLVKQCYNLARGRSKNQLALRSLTARRWNINHRRAYVNNLTVAPRTRRQLDKFKTTYGLPYKSVVETAVNELYVKTFGTSVNRSPKGPDVNVHPSSLIKGATL